jgi:hypothetical protein
LPVKCIEDTLKPGKKQKPSRIKAGKWVRFFARLFRKIGIVQNCLFVAVIPVMVGEPVEPKPVSSGRIQLEKLDTGLSRYDNRKRAILNRY